MLDSIEHGLALFVSYGLPALPYVAISFVVYQIMSQFVKPMIAAHKAPDGSYPDPLWRNLRRGMVFYPMLLGLVASLLLPQLIWGYCVTAGAASQLLYHLLKAFLKKKGIVLPVDSTKSLAVPPPSEEE